MPLIASIAVVLLFGLVVARVPAIGGLDASFSWVRFGAGVAIAAVIASIERISAQAATADSRVSSPLRRWLLRSSLSSVLLALASVVLALYTPWQWPRYVATFAILIAVLSALAGIGTTWFGTQRGT